MFRTETDMLGRQEIPAKALYGIHSQRARENFPDRTAFHIEWYKAIGLVKKACYLTAMAYKKAVEEKFRAKDTGHGSGGIVHGAPGAEHGAKEMAHGTKYMAHGTKGAEHGAQGGDHETKGIGPLDEAMVFSDLIAAASEVAEGIHFQWFIVPAISGGAGTSINMNVNEIIANVALVNRGMKPGNYQLIDPIEHANIYQSTNDVIPTALKVATMMLLQELEKDINHLRFVVEQHESAHHADLRIGFTQMQEAVPTSFGKLFSTYSEALSRDWWRVSKCFERIKTVNLGGSAIGTGMAVPRYFIMEAIGQLQHLTGLPVTRSENLADATSNLDSFVEIHATLKAHAVNLEKMVSDLRLLASDLTSVSSPELTRQTAGDPKSKTENRQSALSIPPRQAGSSIMPGKINPVIPEFVISAAHRIYANDQLISSLSAQGCLELNAYLPVIGHALLDSIKLLIACDQTLKQNLFDGLIVNRETSLALLFRSPAITTALLPVLGYHKATELANYMKANCKDVFEANIDLKMLPDEKLRNLLKAENLLKLGYTLSDLE